jgi:hypothetical protein
MDRNSIQRSACGRSLSAQRTARSRGCRKLLFDDRVGLSASPEDRQPDRGYDQNHQSNDSLNWLYPGLVESHAQSAYDYREHNRKVGLREHFVSTGLLNLCKAQQRGGDLPGICQRRPGNRRAGQVLVIHRPTHSRCSCSSCFSRSLHRLPVLGCGFRSRAPFFRVPFPACRNCICASPT